MRSRAERRSFRRALLFGVLSGCFVSMVSVIVVAGLALTGLLSLGPIPDAIYWALAIFGVSSITIILAALVYDSFCERGSG